MSRLPIERGHLPRPGSGSWLAERSDGHRLHAGVDLVAPVGTRVLAPEAATVVQIADASRPSEPHFSSPAGWGGYGPKIVLLRGVSGVYHLLAHLGAVHVRLGQTVSEGGDVGSVGETSTPHLHWEVRSRPQPTGGAAIVEICGDPATWLRDGSWSPWDGRCPRVPVDDPRTPRACRPSWHGPAPDPFPHPAPPRRREVGVGRRRVRTPG